MTRGAADKDGTAATSVAGHWQDVIAEAETVRIATAQQIEAAVQDWQRSLSAAMTIDSGASFETFLKPWFAMTKPGTGPSDKAPPAQE